MFVEIYILFSFSVIFGFFFLTTFPVFSYPKLLQPVSLLTILSLISSLILAGFTSLYHYTFLLAHFQATTITFAAKSFLLAIALLFSVFVYANCIRLRSLFFVNAEFFLILLLAFFAMLLLMQANDLLLFYIALELLSFSFYVLAGYVRQSVLSTESAIKYFTLGSFSSSLILFGIALTYGSTGLINFIELKLFLSTFYEVSSSVTVAMILLIVGLLFKLGAAPFHMWVPDVYEGSPTVVMSLFALFTKIVYLTVFFTLFTSIFIFKIDSIYYVLYLSSILSVILGSVGAYGQDSFKRFIAFSAIVNTGFLLSAAAFDDLISVYSLYFYLVVYVLQLLAILFVYMSVLQRSLFNELPALSDLNAISAFNPAVSIVLLVLFASIAGFPPFTGFFAKASILFALLNSKLYLLAIFLGIGSVVSAAYYLNVIIHLVGLVKRSNLSLNHVTTISYATTLILSISLIMANFFSLTLYDWSLTEVGSFLNNIPYITLFFSSILFSILLEVYYTLIIDKTSDTVSDKLPLQKMERNTIMDPYILLWGAYDLPIISTTRPVNDIEEQEPPLYTNFFLNIESTYKKNDTK